jgi:hypothetical protein
VIGVNEEKEHHGHHDDLLSVDEVEEKQGHYSRERQYSRRSDHEMDHL